MMALLVIAGIGVIYLGTMRPHEPRSDVVVTMSQIERLAVALEEYRIYLGSYPTGTTDRIIELITTTRARGGSLFLDTSESRRWLIDKQGRFIDAWRYPFVIASDGKKFNIISPGPDGQVGTSDDITK